MRNQMLAVLVLGLATVAPVKADSCPVLFGGFQSGDEPWVFMSGSGSYLGVDTRDVTKERLTALNLKEEAGVEVVSVDQDAPAGKAGLKEKDVILTFNNQKVEGVEQLRRMIKETPPGRQVALGISRNGQRMNVPVTIGDRKQAVKMKMKGDKDKAYAYSYAMPPMPPMDIDIPSFNVVVQSSARNGLMVEGLTPQLADFFGVKGENGGVLVRSVEKGSAAEAAGLKAGDVIVRVDKDKIGDVGDWRRAIRSRSGATPVTIMRDKREQTVNMNFPERKTRETGSVWNDEMNGDVEELRLELENIDPQVIVNTKEIAANVQKELAAQRVEIKKAMREAQKETQKAMKEQQKALQEAQKELEKAQREMENERDKD